MSQDHIRYDILAKDALRGVIKTVISEVAATGRLPGDHYFFITFLTNAHGVRISQNLKKIYPEQMTIVIQNQFWDLKVLESHFEISLSFSDVPERLTVPFNAIRGFYDPSVNFELEFDVSINEITTEEEKNAPILSNNVTKKDFLKNDPIKNKENKKPASVISLDTFRKK